MPEASNQNLFPLCEGKVLPDEFSNNTDDALKYSMAHACFEINTLLLQLKKSASIKSRESEKATLLDALERQGNVRMIWWINCMKEELKLKWRLRF